MKGFKIINQKIMNFNISRKNNFLTKKGAKFFFFVEKTKFLIFLKIETYTSNKKMERSITFLNHVSRISFFSSFNLQ